MGNVANVMCTFSSRFRRSIFICYIIKLQMRRNTPWAWMKPVWWCSIRETCEKTKNQLSSLQLYGNDIKRRRDERVVIRAGKRRYLRKTKDTTTHRHNLVSHKIIKWHESRQQRSTITQWRTKSKSSLFLRLLLSPFSCIKLWKNDKIEKNMETRKSTMKKLAKIITPLNVHVHRL